MDPAIVNSAAGNVASWVFGRVRTEISYIWNYDENVEKLKIGVKMLKDMRGRIQQQIDMAKRKGDDLLYGVQDWVDKANILISNAERFIVIEANATYGLCGNWVTLYQHGKEATIVYLPLPLHQQYGMSYASGVSVYTRVPGPLEVYENKNLDDIVTHKSALVDIITALEDESIQIIGIYGLGGVGKTTLAKEVVERVKNTLFADVAFTTVSQSVKVEAIKNDIAEATKKIMNGDKILIILDDVWEKLNLEELCIPCGSKHRNCKILLTSRNKDVCQKMNAQSKILVNPLPTKEAWILFKRVVGERLETDAHLIPVAKEVAEECGGLPLFILAVGNALKEKSLYSWNLALNLQKSHASLDVDPDIKKAYIHLKLSYDYLDNDEAKSCFLLCSMFPEDYYILLEDLVRYRVGLAKFNEFRSVEDARQRVGVAVNILTSSGLLLNVDDRRKTKMHDVVREVALLISSDRIDQSSNNFFVEAGKGLREWLPRNNSLESYTGISLMNNKIYKLPNYEVHLPDLDIFIISNNRELSMVSNEFIRGMKEIKVLDMSFNQISFLPQSLKLLTKLRVLNLGENKALCEISILGELKNLEILILSGTGIKEIPQEIGQLVNLSRLEVNDCKDLSHITPNVLAKLWRLEELCIEFTSIHEGISDCIAEVMKLSKLTYLDLAVPSANVIPEDFWCEKLKGFVIEIGGNYPRISVINPTLSSERYLVIHKDNLRIPLVKWMKKLILVSRPNICLKGVRTLQNIIPNMYNEGFNNLEYIELRRCPYVSCLADTIEQRSGVYNKKFFMELKHIFLTRLERLEVLWKCPDKYISFTKLVKLEIYCCDELVRVFSVSVARGLANLKIIRIHECFRIEDVIWGSENEKEIGRGKAKILAGHSANTSIIVFPCLIEISLFALKSLKMFYSGNCTIRYPSLVNASARYCKNMHIWGPGIHETPNLKSLSGNNYVQLLDGPCAINDAVAKNWRKS